MFEAPLDLSTARILVSNDDGIDAPGLKLLERVARRLSGDVWVVAPETEQSAASHSLTLRRPLRIRRLSRRRFAVDGTPTDSVLLAVQQIMKAHRPDLVLSGINRGGNLGEDVTYSGTIAAAMEATLLDVPGIALSQYISPDGPVRWGPAERFAEQVIRTVTSVPWPKAVMVNVNFPDTKPSAVSGIRVCGQGRRKLGENLVERIDPRGEPYYWIGALREEERSRRATDIAAIHEKAITVTPLHLDLTHAGMLKTLGAAFK